MTTGLTRATNVTRGFFKILTRTSYCFNFEMKRKKSYSNGLTTVLPRRPRQLILLQVLSDVPPISMLAVAPCPHKIFNRFTILNSSTDVYRVRTYRLYLVTSTSFEEVGRFDNPVTSRVFLHILFIDFVLNVLEISKSSRKGIEIRRRLYQPAGLDPPFLMNCIRHFLK